MRSIHIVIWLVVGLVGAALTPVSAQRSADPQPLAAFARQLGLRDTAGFVEAVTRLRSTRELPPRYVTKDAAKARGWQGGGLCKAWPGHMIGGDPFHNFGGKLPAAPGRAYREADLDATCRSRGPRRLVFSSDGLIYVTIDHYNSFVPVP